MKSNKQDTENERFISDRYQGLLQEQPNDLLDKRILEQSQLTSRTNQRVKRSYTKKSWSIAASFFLVTFITYFVVQQSPFVSDDELLLPENISLPTAPTIKTPLEALSSNKTTFRTRDIKHTKSVSPSSLSQNVISDANIQAKAKKTEADLDTLTKLVSQYNRLTQLPQLTQQDKTQLEIIQKEVFTELEALLMQYPDRAINPLYLDVLTDTQRRALEK